MSLTKKVTGGVLWLATAQIARRASGIVIMAVLAHLLKPVDFGLIALTSVTTGFIAIFADMGVTSALVQRTEVGEEHLATGFWLSLSLSSFLALIGIILAYPIAILYKEPRLVSLLRVMMLTLPISSLGQVSDVLLQRRLAFKQIAAIDWVSSLTAGLIGVGLASAGVGVWALVAQSIALPLIATCGRLVAAKWIPQIIFNHNCVRDLLAFGLAVLGCAVVNYGVTNVDNALIGGVLGAKALGYYMMAYTLAMMPSSSAGSLVSRVMFPALSSIQTDLPRFRNAYMRMLRVVAAVTFPCSIGLGATAPFFVRAVYGEQWAPVIPLLQVLIIWSTFQAINLSGNVFYALGKPNIILYYATGSLALMTLTFAVSVRWGLMGVTWATALVSLPVCLGPHVLANRLISLSGRMFCKSIAPPLFAALMMGAVIQLLLYLQLQPFQAVWANLLIMVATGAISYAAILVTIGIAFGYRPSSVASWFMGHPAATLNPEPQALLHTTNL